ncbi:hypothetical protein SAMN04515660_2746 [Luteibacter sp. 329MFSha]|nr:hypothetical protein SAMN04515660_2746 [Luteibacter sp. 329MFSha]
MVVCTIVGIARAYSPVPYWDMWDGYVGFYLRTASQGWRAWIEPHNEHRLVLSRLFFYADIAWLGGRGLLPLCVNVLITAGIATLLCRAATTTGISLAVASMRAIYAVIVGVTFFWSQRENFTWAFQTQFFLAQLLPLLAFCLAAQATGSPRRVLLAGCATGCGMLALGAMANGILALPILLVLGMCLDLGRRWVIATAAITLAAILLVRYAFHDAQVPTPAFSVLVERPLDVAHFLFRYLGSPIFFAFKNASWASGIVEASGALLLMGALCCLPAAWRDRSRLPLRLAMLATIAYVAASALGTAIGRLPLPAGLEGAFVSRYTGLALTAWLALLIAWLPALRPVRPSVVIVALIALLIGLMPWQLRATRAQTNVVYARELAALALAAQFDDPAAIAAVYPEPAAATAMRFAAEARRAGVPAFGRPAIASAPGWLGLSVTHAVCQAGVETGEALSSTPADYRIAGHLQQPLDQSTDVPALVLDEHDTIVGWVLLGPEASRTRENTVGRRRFSGYVRDARPDVARSHTPSLRICQTPAGAPFAFSE